MSMVFESTLQKDSNYVGGGVKGCGFSLCAMLLIWICPFILEGGKWWRQHEPVCAENVKE